MILPFVDFYWLLRIQHSHLTIRYFIKLYNAGLQWEFIRTYFDSFVPFVFLIVAIFFEVLLNALLFYDLTCSFLKKDIRFSKGGHEFVFFEMWDERPHTQYQLSDLTLLRLEWITTMSYFTPNSFIL